MLRVYAAVNRKHCFIFYSIAFLPQKYEASCLGQPSLIQPHEPLSKEELASSRSRIILSPVGIISNLFPWIVWNIWISRNHLFFEKKATSPHEVIIKATTACKEWECAQNKQIIPAQQKNPYLPPPQPLADTVMCYTDAAWKSNLRAVGLAWIFTDHNSTEISRGSCYQDNVSSPLLAEVLAIRSVLTQAASLNLNQIQLRSDSQGLVTAINMNQRSIQLFGVLVDVESLISSAFSFVSFSFISRRFNGSADLLAKVCLCSNSIMGF